MPRRRFIDKKTATTFQVLHRPQHDPRIYDDATPSVVFQEQGAQGPSSSYGAPSSSSSYVSGNRPTTLEDLASQYGGSIRGNEGEAAEYGVYYDDTEYDYMQHMRDLGSGGTATWVEARSSQSNKQGKRKQDLADALRDMDIAHGQGEESDEQVPSLVPASIPADARSAYSLPSWASEKSHTDRVIESQLDIPTDIAGFQPDMDPRLREVLEALQDDAYVDAEDEEDIFGALSGEGVEVSLDEFERLGDFMGEEGDEEGWESDDTVKAADTPSRQLASGGVSLGAVQHPADSGTIPGAAEDGDEADGAWLSEFSKFKKDQKSAPAPAAPSTTMTGASSKLWDLPGAARTKKRKGALTEDSSYSMTSSTLFRNDNQTLLDKRFDRLEANYAADAADEYDADDSMSMASGMTGMSKMSSFSAMSGFSSTSRASAISQQPKGLRSDFDNIMDDFLGPSRGSTAAASRRGGKSNRTRNGAGLEQLDEIRKGLGPARFAKSVQKA